MTINLFNNSGGRGKFAGNGGDGGVGGKNDDQETRVEVVIVGKGGKGKKGGNGGAGGAGGAGINHILKNPSEQGRADSMRSLRQKKESPRGGFTFPSLPVSELPV